MIRECFIGKVVQAEPAAQRHASPDDKAKPKRGNAYARTVQDVSSNVPDCATSSSPSNSLTPSYFVPVSFAAKDWSVTPRRIRSLLTAQRLQGRREVNGYWEVAYPYRFIIGTRGPVLKRQQKSKRGRPKSEERAESLPKITLQESRKS